MVFELEKRNVVRLSALVTRDPGALTMLSTLVALCLNPPKCIENIFLAREVPESENKEASGSSLQQSGGDAGSADDKGGIWRASDSREEGGDRKRRRLSEKGGKYSVIDSSDNKVSNIFLCQSI